MAAESIISQDLSLAEVFQSFYKVPSYQREYVWGEADDGKGTNGDEVERFLEDINNEFSEASGPDAPEYFIGTIVVCAGEDKIFELIDGQQRTTTSFLVLCAIRDALVEAGIEPPSTLKGQIADGSMDWKGETVHRMRLDLQYEEKPLRFLRYYLLSSYDIETYLREEEIYNWFEKNKGKTNHVKEPLAFAQQLRDGAIAYRHFNKGQNPLGDIEHGIVNTRCLGGSAVKQHYILLLAGRHLERQIFESLCESVEQLMFIWLIADVPTKEYERLIIQAARRLRATKTRKQFEAFVDNFIYVEKQKRLKDFQGNMYEICSWDLRKFRLKYLLAKITQFVEMAAYGEQGRKPLAHYLDTQNDVEHILAINADEKARAEFGDGADDPAWVESLGNLMWLERSINRSIQNLSYSDKLAAYSTSHFLLARCQSEQLKVGVNDRITRTIKKLHIAPSWNKEAIEKRQKWIADISLDVWGLRP